MEANSRGGKVLVLDSYRYNRNNRNELKIYWRCGLCASTVHTNVFDVNNADAEIRVLAGPSPHAHDPDEDLVQTSTMIGLMNNMVREDPSMPLKRVYDRVSILGPTFLCSFSHLLFK